MKLAHIVLPLLLLSACSEKSAESYLESAKANLENNNQEAAIIELKNAIRTEPAMAEARFLLGKSYLYTHQYPQAEKELERALELEYSAEKVVPLLSQAYQKTGANNALLDLPFQKVGLSEEQAAEVYFYKLQALINLEQTEKAKNFVEKIKALNTKSPFKSLGLVYNLLLLENVEAANIALDEILTKHPQQADALKLKANLLLNKGEIALAIETYRSYVETYPEDLEMSFIFARILTDASQTAEAEPIVDRLLKINSQNPLLNQLKSIARFNAKDFEQALSSAESALVNSPDDTALRLIAGVSAFYQKNAEKTHQHLSLIASILPPSHQALRLLAASQLQLGLSLEANDTIKQFDNITAKDSALLTSVGLALIDSGEVSKAKEILSKTPEVGETSEALAKLGLLKISLNDLSGILNLEQALENIETPEQESPIGRVLATAYLSTSQFDKALALAQTWKDSAETRAEGFMLAGLTYTKLKQYNEAKTEFDAAKTLDPNNAQAKMALIELQVVSDDSFTAEKELNALLNLLNEHNNFIPALSRAFVLAQDTNKGKTVIETAQQAVKENPSNIELTLTLSKMYYANKNYSAAIDNLANITLDDKTSTALWAILGQSYLQQNDFGKAMKHYEQWLSFQPNNAEAIVGNVVLLESRREFKQALEISQEYIDETSSKKELIPTHMQILHAHLLLLNKAFEDARAILTTLPEQAKKQPVAIGLLGQIQLHDKEYQAALPNLEAAYENKPTPRNARMVYMCLSVLEQFKQAFTFLETHLKNNPNDQANLMELAMQQISFDPNAAIASYQKALTLNENNIVAHNNIAYLYLQQNQLEMAKKHAEKAFSVEPENRDILDTLGQVALLQGDNEQALEYLSKAVKLFKSTEKVNELIFINYIEALFLNDKKAQANSRLRDVTFEDETIAAKAEALKIKYN